MQRLQDRDGGASQPGDGAAGPREGARARRCRPSSKSIQAAIDALNGKEPDAALQARVKAFQTKRSRPQRGAASSAAADPGATRQYIQQADRATSSGPIYRRSCSGVAPIIMVEIGTTLASGAALDVTNDVLAALNAALPTRPATHRAAPAAQPTQPQGR